mmetsp:Transcript_128904/g.305825  ORF Transcript_128904/g.305825 Transcript_128904/m.305825 type:complete len:422 (-) Transcript_128904:48-1313(-)
MHAATAGFGATAPKGPVPPCTILGLAHRHHAVPCLFQHRLTVSAGDDFAGPVGLARPATVGACAPLAPGTEFAWPVVARPAAAVLDLHQRGRLGHMAGLLHVLQDGAVPHLAPVALLGARTPLRPAGELAKVRLGRCFRASFGLHEAVLAEQLLATRNLRHALQAAMPEALEHRLRAAFPTLPGAHFAGDCVGAKLLIADSGLSQHSIAGLAPVLREGVHTAQPRLGTTLARGAALCPRAPECKLAVLEVHVGAGPRLIEGPLTGPAVEGRLHRNAPPAVGLVHHHVVTGVAPLGPVIPNAIHVALEPAPVLREALGAPRFGDHFGSVAGPAALVVLLENSPLALAEAITSAEIGPDGPVAELAVHWITRLLTGRVVAGLFLRLKALALRDRLVGSRKDHHIRLGFATQMLPVATPVLLLL